MRRGTSHAKATLFFVWTWTAPTGGRTCALTWSGPSLESWMLRVLRCPRHSVRMLCRRYATSFKALRGRAGVNALETSRSFTLGCARRYLFSAHLPSPPLGLLVLCSLLSFSFRRCSLRSFLALHRMTGSVVGAAFGCYFSQWVLREALACKSQPSVSLESECKVWKRDSCVGFCVSCVFFMHVLLFCWCTCSVLPAEAISWFSLTLFSMLCVPASRL